MFLEGGPLGRRFNCCLKEITPLGELVDRLAANPIDKYVNRDFLVLSDTEVLYLAHEVIEIDDTAKGGEPGTEVLVDSIRVWDQTNDTTREVWNALDHFSLDQRVDWNADRPPISWQRANSLAMGVRGNYIVSLANWDQVISISPDGQSIEWQLGGPDTDYHFLDPADRFYGQHTGSELSNGKHPGVRQRERTPRRGGRAVLQGARAGAEHLRPRRDKGLGVPARPGPVRARPEQRFSDWRTAIPSSIRSRTIRNRPASWSRWMGTVTRSGRRRYGALLCGTASGRTR